jgi:hypothetical protein
MNGVFREYLDKFVIFLLDDILIYSRTKEWHELSMFHGNLHKRPS